MKRFIIAIMAVAMVLSCLIVPAVAEDDTVVVTIAPDDDPIDGECTFVVSVTGLSPLLSAKIVPVFDEDVLELADGWWLVDAPLANFSLSEGDGVIVWHEPAELCGEVLAFTLRLKDEAFVGTYSVSCELFVIDENDVITEIEGIPSMDVLFGCYHDYSAEIADERYLVDGYVNRYYVSCAHCGKAGGEIFIVIDAGDVDGDGYIMTNDIANLARYLSGSTVEITVGADVNLDGDVTTTDISTLRRILA